MPKFEKYDLAEQAPAEAAAPAAEATAAVAESPPGKSRRRCPLCQGELVVHGPENPYKAGAYHCNNPECGMCWTPDLKGPRDGHPMPKAVEPFEAR